MSHETNKLAERTMEKLLFFQLSPNLILIVLEDGYLIAGEKFNEKFKKKIMNFRRAFGCNGFTVDEDKRR